ncbi:hypothetical protein [Nitrospirillum viridazoti]|uniref:Tetratricopeptide repeat protein n=1 Tax=Nitrospirillum amazonense TaxID=28077 RepID=A0A560IHM1_9PROT|nr:hypothetical protein [Nitrospirillum amazonense]TWB56594.1 hypothetical protein FBZ92_11014 [Nitrospirillum amazonense]
MPSRTVVARALLALAISSASPTASAKSPWTRQDVDGIVDMALTRNGTGARGATEMMALTDLAQALLKAGNRDKARAAAIAATRLLQVPAIQQEAYWRGKLIEILVLTGDSAAARALAMAEAPPPALAMAQGRLATALVQSGDKAAALQVAKGITIPALPSGTMAGLRLDVAHVLPPLAKALAEAGAPNEALRLLAKPQPDLSKVQLLSKVAVVLCSITSGQQATPSLGRKVAIQAVDTARTALVTADPFDRFDLIENAANAAASCFGAEAARNFVVAHASSKIQENAVLAALVRGLIVAGDRPLAHSLMPAPEPTDIGALMDAADLLVKMDDLPGALALAEQSFSLASLAKAPGQGPAILHTADRFSTLSHLSGLLASLGAYDEALETIQAIELRNRLQFYVSLTERAMRRNDDAGVTRLTANAIAALKADMDGPNGAYGHLYDLTRQLAKAGYKAETQTAYGELQAITPGPYQKLTPYKSIMLRVDMGDVMGAVDAANALGTMTAKPSPMALMALTTMMFDNAEKPPTTEEVAKAMETARKMMPAQVAGPRADSLIGIANELALLGNVPMALEIESSLEGETNENIVAKRDMTLVVIAKAQIKAGNLHDALTTSLRISAPARRWEPLLQLASFPPNP